MPFSTFTLYREFLNRDNFRAFISNILVMYLTHVDLAHKLRNLDTENFRGRDIIHRYSPNF